MTTAIPSLLVAIIVATLFSLLSNSGVPTVGARGELPATLPSFGIPDISFNLETLPTNFLYAIAISLIGLLESFPTANVVDDLTDTPSNNNKEAHGQEIANFVSYGNGRRSQL